MCSLHTDLTTGALEKKFPEHTHLTLEGTFCLEPLYHHNLLKLSVVQQMFMRGQHDQQKLLRSVLYVVNSRRFTNFLKVVQASLMDCKFMGTK